MTHLALTSNRVSATPTDDDDHRQIKCWTWNNAELASYIQARVDGHPRRSFTIFSLPHDAPEVIQYGTYHDYLWTFTSDSELYGTAVRNEVVRRNQAAVLYNLILNGFVTTPGEPDVLTPDSLRLADDPIIGEE